MLWNAKEARLCGVRVPRRVGSPRAGAEDEPRREGGTMDTVADLLGRSTAALTGSFARCRVATS
jgi:hypothetical protein